MQRVLNYKPEPRVNETGTAWRVPARGSSKTHIADVRFAFGRRRIDIDRGFGFVTHIAALVLSPRSPSLLLLSFSRVKGIVAVVARRCGNLSPREGTIEGVGGSVRWKQEGHAVQRPLVARRIAFRRLLSSARASRRAYTFILAAY